MRPFRFIDDPTPADIKAEMGPEYDRRMNREGTAPEPVKMVVAWVYNYDTQNRALLSFTKSLVRELDQIHNEDYQPLDNFDLIMGKEGSGLTTVYSLKAVPRKKDAVNEVSSSWDAAESAGYNIQNLLTGDNPFKAVG